MESCNSCITMKKKIERVERMKKNIYFCSLKVSDILLVFI